MPYEFADFSHAFDARVPRDIHHMPAIHVHGKQNVANFRLRLVKLRGSIRPELFQMGTRSYQTLF